MSRLSREGRLYYVIGNHDYEINLFHEILQFRVCDEIHIGDRMLVVHGWQFDPYLKDAIYSSHGYSTTIHHLVERWLGTWLRIPIGEFYTRSNRLLFWPCPAEVVPFREILEKPYQFVDFLCAYLRINPTAEQRQMALAFNNPRQNAYRLLQLATVGAYPRQVGFDLDELRNATTAFLM